MPDDYLVQAAIGALQGFTNAYVPYQQAKQKDLLNQQAEQRQMENELSLYKAKLPLEQQAQQAKFQRDEFIPAEQIPVPARTALGLNPGETVRKEAFAPSLSYLTTNRRIDSTPNEEEKLTARNNAKLSIEKPKATGSFNKAKAGIEEALALVDKIDKNPDLKFATGMTSFTGSLPGTPMRTVATDIDTLKNKIMLETIQGLKELSKTGATSFGQLSNQEGETLKNSVANLDRSIKTEDFRRNLEVVRKNLQNTLQNIEDTYNSTYGQLGTSSARTTPTDTKTIRPSLDSFAK